MPRATVVQNPNLANPVFDDFLDDGFLGDLDQAFTQIQIDKPSKNSGRQTRKGTSRSTTKAEYAQMRKTFVSLAQEYLSPVVRYVKAVEQGVVNKDITTITEYIVSPLISKCRNIGLVEETKTLIELQKVIKSINRSQTKEITPEQQQKLVTAFEPLRAQFKLKYRGHAIAVLNIVAFYKTIKVKTKRYTPVDLKKLFSIGISSLSMIRKTSIEELSSLTGIDAQVVADLRQEARDFTLYTFV
ncbi:MAG: helix-hairpin-helix domain-containing protein [Bdellovibrionota bacterium]